MGVLPASIWVRKTYYVEEPAHPQDPVVAYDKETGKKVGSWPEGGYLPEHIYRRYLTEVPGALGELRHMVKQHPEMHSTYEKYIR